MKKQMICLFLVFMLAMVFSVQVSADVRIKIVYGKNEIICDVPPIIVNDRTMVPARAIFEAIGAEVTYEEETRKVTATKDDKTIALQIDSNIMLVNDKTVILESPAFIKDDRTLVPVRACAESFDLDVDWLGEARIVKIKRGVWLETKSVDSNGVIQEKTYDERGNLLFDGRNITYTYDTLDNQLTVSATGGGGYYNTYDVYGNLIKKIAPYGNETTYTYDDDRRIVTESVKSRMSPLPTVYRYSYDAAGNLIRKETADGGTWEAWTYDEQNRFLRRENSYGEWNSTTYDEKGNPITSDNHRGEWTKWEYDERGNTILQSDAHGTTSYSYDEEGNLICSEQSDGFWMQYTYDENGRQIKWETPSFSVTYTYDVYGNVVREERNDGYYTAYTYEYFLQ